ncbi:hypothetical protein HMPREF9374_3203 [Desmospora sp. 8437]|nr:hypothetical protein HMPREF9374_3203 [Desmospora sp. 8437]
MFATYHIAITGSGQPAVGTPSRNSHMGDCFVQPKVMPLFYAPPLSLR